MEKLRVFSQMSRATKALVAGITLGITALSITWAAVTVTSGPTALFASAQTVPAMSQPLGLFKLDLKQDAGENLGSVTVHVNNVAPAGVVSSDIANVSVYKDNGDGDFNPASDVLAGSQTAVAIDGDTTITTAANNSVSTSTTVFFVSMQTGSTWSSTTTPDMITVTFPANGLNMDNPTSTPAVTAATTPVIQADSAGPVLTSVIAADTAVTPTKTAGDTLVFTFNEATNKPAITTANVDTVLSVNNGHSLKNGGAVLGATAWNAGGTELTLTLNDNGFGVPTVLVGDMVASMGTMITDAVGNPATGSATITGTFGDMFGSTVSTQVRNGSNADVTNTALSFGTAVHDYATVNGVGSTTTATGTVTFNLYGMSNCTGSALSSEQMALSGGNASSNATTTLAAGSYGYKASYAGNEMYSASNGVCEPFSVVGPTTNLTPTIQSNIQNSSNTNIAGQTVTTGTVVHDYAVVSGSNGTPTGSVDFMRYANGTCSGDPSVTESNIALNGIGAAASGTYTTVAGMLSYRVHYDGNGTYLPGDGACQSLTVQDVVPPTPTTQCENGLINGRLYMVMGKSKIWLAADCRLKEFRGNAIGHAKGKKFQDIIPLPTQGVDDNGNIVQTFTIIMLDHKPVTIHSDSEIREKHEKTEKHENEGHGNKGNGNKHEDGNDD